MEENDWIAAGLAVLGAFLIFIGGWSIFTSLSVFSTLGLSTGYVIDGVPLLSIGVSVALVIIGVVCVYYAYRYSSVERWGSIEALFGLVLVALLVAQVVYAYQGDNLPPSDGGGVPSEPSLSGSYQLFADGVALSDNVPFGIYYNGVRLGGDARITINADLVLKGYTGSPGQVQFPIAFSYAPMTSSGQWASWAHFPVVVTVPNPMWVRSGSDWRASIRNLAVTTISGTDTRFFYYKKCRFKLNVYATLGGSLSTGACPTEFILESRAGSLEIEYAGGWAS